MSASVRPAEPSDVARLAELLRAAIAEQRPERGGELYAQREARPEPLEATLAADLADPDVALFVGEWAGYPAGLATVRIERLRGGAHLGRLEELYTEAAFREVGVGAAMMDAVMAHCTAAGCRGIDALALPGDRHTKNFFESYGLKARALTVHVELGPEPTPPGTGEGSGT